MKEHFNLKIDDGVLKPEHITLHRAVDHMNNGVTVRRITICHGEKIYRSPLFIGEDRETEARMVAFINETQRKLTPHKTIVVQPKSPERIFTFE